VSQTLPADFLDFVRPDTSRAVRVSPGVWYRYLWSPVGPWALHLVEADLSRCHLGLQVVRAPGDGGTGGAHATVTRLVAMAGRDGSLPVAVNGDFFTPEGAPLGPEVTAAGARSLRSRPVVAWSPASGPWIGTADVRGDTLLVGWGRVGDDARVVGGYPELLDDGAPVGDLLVGDNPGFAATRHPRTALGFDPTSRRLWLVVVDGRQGGYSAGMTLPELARLFGTLGAREAINLDGGGSSVLVVGGRAVSRPSDPAGERPVVNALALRVDEAYCVPAGSR
jgi:hypothetical protein